MMYKLVFINCLVSVFFFSHYPWNYYPFTRMCVNCTDAHALVGEDMHGHTAPANTRPAHKEHKTFFVEETAAAAAASKLILAVDQ